MSIREAKGKRRPKYKCAHCFKNFAAGKCPLCRKQYYCTRQCQKVDWENHKLYCSGFNADEPPLISNDKDAGNCVVETTARVNVDTEITVSNSAITTPITKHKDQKRASTVHRNSIEQPKNNANPTGELVTSPAPACAKRKFSLGRPSNTDYPTNKKFKSLVLPRVVEKGPGVRTSNDGLAIATTTTTATATATKPTNPSQPKKAVRTKTYMQTIVNTVRNHIQVQVQFKRIIAQKKSDAGLMYLLEPPSGKPDSDYTWMRESQVKQKYRSLIVTWKEECPNTFNVVSTRALQIHPVADDRKFCNFCDRYGGKLLKCSRDKSHQAHQECLSYTDEQFAATFEWKWQCPECLSCGICKKDNNPETILCCDRCARGRHSTCIQMKTMPKEEDDWFCFGCEKILKKRKLEKSATKELKL